MAEWSKALASGASPQGHGFAPHSCHFQHGNAVCDIWSTKVSAKIVLLHLQLDLQLLLHASTSHYSRSDRCGQVTCAACAHISALRLFPRAGSLYCAYRCAAQWRACVSAKHCGAQCRRFDICDSVLQGLIAAESSPCPQKRERTAAFSEGTRLCRSCPGFAVASGKIQH